MKLYKLISKDPYINLATEEYFFKQTNDNVILIWQNDNAIIIGRNQNAYSEINNIYAEEHNIKIVRRITGGGAVYHDMGNVNFTFISRNNANNFSIPKFLTDIIDFLHSLNIDAKFSGRNDIVLGGKKISGVASTILNNDVLIHGTLLYNSNIDNLMNSLNVDKLKIDSKGIESVKSRVTNICEVLNLTLDEFIHKLLVFLELKYKIKTIDFDVTNNEFINHESENKFKTYNWNFGKNFEFNFENKLKNEHGVYHVQIKVDDGIIKKMKLFTDSLLNQDFEIFENLFINQKYEIKTVKLILSNNKSILFDLKISAIFLLNLLFKLHI